MEIGTFCKDCTQEMAYKEMFAKEYEDFVLDVCVDCRRYFSAGKWKPYEKLSSIVVKQFERYVKQYVHPLIRYQVILHRLEQDIVDNDEALNKILHIHPYKFEIEIRTPEYVFTLPCTIRRQQCNLCAKKGTQYFEAIVQLRNVPKKAKTYFLQLIADQYQKKGVYINKTVDLKNGVDYYLTKKNYAKRLIQEMQHTFGGSVGYHPTLFSQDSQTSKPLYRLTVIYRYPQFSEGDIIQDKFGHDLEVLNIGKNVYARRVEDDIKKEYSYDDLGDRYI